MVGIFPDRAAVLRLVGAVLAERNFEWLVGRRNFSLETIAKTLSMGSPEAVVEMAMIAA